MTTSATATLNAKETGSINLSARVKRIFVLVIAILIGMIISATTADAKDYKRENQKKYKAVYKKQNNMMANACQILKEKRNKTTNKVVRDNGKLKYR